MKDYIEERTITLANYIIENKCTVRAAAKMFHVSKSTVHKDVGERIWEIDKSLAGDVAQVLKINKNTRHLRGGMATKRKYEALKTEQRKNA